MSSELTDCMLLSRVAALRDDDSDAAADLLVLTSLTVAVSEDGKLPCPPQRGHRKQRRQRVLMYSDRQRISSLRSLRRRCCSSLACRAGEGAFSRMLRANAARTSAAAGAPPVVGDLDRRGRRQYSCSTSSVPQDGHRHARGTVSTAGLIVVPAAVATAGRDDDGCASPADGPTSSHGETSAAVGSGVTSVEAVSVVEVVGRT